MEYFGEEVSIEQHRTIHFLSLVEKNVGNVTSLVHNILNNSFSFEDFKAMLLRVNGVICGKKKNERVFCESVCLRDENRGGIKAMTPNDKESYLLKLYESITSIDDLKNKAILLYYGIQFIHPFNDGNGRTGRVLYKIASEGFSSKTISGFLDILENNEGRVLFDENYLLAAGIVRDEVLKKYHQDIGIHLLEQENSLTFVQKRMLINAINNTVFETSDEDLMGEKRLDFKNKILTNMDSPFRFAEYAIALLASNFNVEEILKREYLSEEEIDFLLDEHKKYEDFMMNCFLDIEQLLKIIKI